MQVSSLSLDALQHARRHLRQKLIFPPVIEPAYRATQDARHRLPRVILFLVAALAFALAPVYGPALFQPTAEVLPLLQLIWLAWAFPALALAAVATWRGWPQQLTFHLHTAAVLSLWAVVLLCSLFAQLGWMEYPVGLVGVSVLAVAVFGGFRTRRFIIGSCATFGVLLWMLWSLRSAPGAASRETYLIVMMWIISVGGIVSLDMLSRAAWINHEYARALSQRDGLTELLNRKTFNDLFQRVVAQAARERRPLGLALLDLDHFKSINDRFGHLKGDEVLVLAAQAIASAGGQRPLDLQARFGGEEFVLVWFDLPRDLFVEQVDRLQAAIRAVRYEVPGADRLMQLTASIGAVWTVPAAAHLGTELLRTADHLLYDAKAAGRNLTRLETYPLPDADGGSGSGAMP